MRIKKIMHNLYIMGIADSIRGIFTKRERISGNDLIERINSSMNLLVQKANNLNDQFENEKKEISEIAKIAASIRISKKIFSVKLEQEILGHITAVSSACDSLLSGNSEMGMKPEISALKATITQRASLK